MRPIRFRDRVDAGQRLAAELRGFAKDRPIVLALPRGGVPVAAEVARALKAPLDVWVVRKLGVPWQPELGFGAVAEGGAVYLSDDLLEQLDLSEEDIGRAVEAKRREVAARVKLFRGERPPPVLRGRTVLLVDDGIATGGTVRAALQTIRAEGPKAIVLAVPVAAPEALQSLSREADRVVALLTPPELRAIGEWYEDFTQTSDDEVQRLLERSRVEQGPPPGDVQGHEVTLRIPAGDVTLEGDLAVPTAARGLVVFAHGSGSSRKSPRNRFVAEALRERGLATLLFDLLTPAEERRDAVDAHLRFDIPLLAERLVQVTDWLQAWGGPGALPLGLFGASTGAAAALIAAAQRPDAVKAVVSRGGRPDLAGEAQFEVRAPTLLIVGGDDAQVLELNRESYARLGGPKELAVVPGATHLFEEPGALEEVARLAGAWFVRFLG